MSAADVKSAIGAGGSLKERCRVYLRLAAGVEESSKRPPVSKREKPK